VVGRSNIKESGQQPQHVVTLKHVKTAQLAAAYVWTEDEFTRTDGLKMDKCLPYTQAVRSSARVRLLMMSSNISM